MNRKIGRNAPCLCGSGKKYKKCCLAMSEKDIQAEYKPKYRFEPGSYGDVGHFIPSIACLKLTQSGSWEYHFVLVNSGLVVAEEDQAVKYSTDDLAAAFELKKEGGDTAIAVDLKSKGYASLKDFKIVGNGKLQA